MTRPAFDSLESRRLFAYDLAMTAISTDQAAVQPGGTLTGSITVSNIGDTASPPSRAYFALTRNDAQAGNPGIVSGIGFVDVPALQPGSGPTVLQVSLPISNVVPAGRYFFSSVVSTLILDNIDPTGDNDLQQDDFNGDNNQLSTSSRIIVSPRVNKSVGTPDPGFGTQGTAVASVALDVRVAATYFDSASRTQFAAATIVSPSTRRLALLHFNPDGSPDTSFGDNSTFVRTVPNAPAATAKWLTSTTDGKLLLIGMTADNDVVLARFDLTGTLDSSFGNNGVAIISAAAVNSIGTFEVVRILRGESGNLAYIVVNATKGGRQRIVVARLAGDTLDTTFGTNGLVIVNQGAATNDVVRSARILPDGRLVLVGAAKSEAGAQALAAVLTASGQPDSSFNKTGLFLLKNQTYFDTFTTVEAGLNSNLYLGGFSRNSDNAGSTPFVVRLSLGGAPERFGKAGVAQVPVPAVPFASVASLVPTADGGVLVAIRTATAAAGLSSGRVGTTLARLLPIGTPLKTYGAAGLVTVTDPPVLPAAAADADFDSFASTRAGSVDNVGNGSIRILTDTSNSSQTTFTLTQIRADGVDLEVSAKTVFSGSVISGRTGVCTYTLSNFGTLPFNGPATITLSLQTSLTDNTGVTLPPITVPLKLPNGVTRKLSLRFVYPQFDDHKGYFVLVSADSGPATDIDTSNNTAAASGAVRIGKPYTDLRFSSLPGDLRIARGASGTFKVPISNAGNVPATGKGTATLQLVSDPSGSNPISLGDIPFAASIGAGKSGFITLRGKVPNIDIPSGRYLRVLLSGALFTLDTDTTDNNATTPNPVT
jgi:uncharacterized delta-60 repeat protein